MDKNGFLNFLRKDSKKLRADLIAVLATGVVLIIIGNTFFGPTDSTTEKITAIQNSETSQGDTDEQLEKRLAEVFSEIEGAGKVKVMLTLKAGTEIIVAEEEKIKESNDGVDMENSVVILSQGNGVEKPLILKEKYPEVEGIIIVAEGGDDFLVKEALSKGAQALLNVPAHKVEIFKMG